MSKMQDKAPSADSAPNVTPSVISSIVDLAENYINTHSDFRSNELANRASPMTVLSDFFKDLKALKDLLPSNGIRRLELIAAVSDLRNSLSNKV